MAILPVILAGIAVTILAGCSESPAPAERAAPQHEVSRDRSRGAHLLRVDTAGHLALAARRDEQPAPRGAWDGGVVPVGIAVGADGSVFWAQYRTNTIGRANPDGTGATTIATVDGPLGIAVDRSSATLFFTTDRHFPRTIGRVRPGAQPETLVFGDDVNRPFSIALAEARAKLYWTESINGRIRSSAADGNALDTIFDDGISSGGEGPNVIARSPLGIAVDEPRGLLFWSDLRTGTIFRSRLDGSDAKAILSRKDGLDMPTALAVDASRGKLYWADPGAESIGRADLNGLYPEIVATAAGGVLEPYGLAIDGERRLLYWSDIARNGLYRARLDQAGVEQFLSFDATVAPSGLAGEAAGGCADAAKAASRDFLRRWVKSVRTCVVAVSATQAVIRAPDDLRVAAGTCARQLRQAHDRAPLHAAFAPHCDAPQSSAAIDATLGHGAEIVAADLPRTADYLRKIRPFIAAAQASEALAALDGIVARLDASVVPPASAREWTIPASGQRTTYAATTRRAGRQVPVPDDGSLRAGAPFAHVDNGDGTITDPTTGLMWEKKCRGCGGLHDVDTRVPWRAEADDPDVAAWLRAVNAEGGAGFAGYGDWRLPETSELISILDYERFNPGVAPAFDAPDCGLECSSLQERRCSCTTLGTHWAGGPSPNAAETRPVVAVHLGLVLGERVEHEAAVRAVRGPLPQREGRFVDNGDGTVTDRVTRLMWEKKCHCPESLHDVGRRGYWSFDGHEETIWDWLDALNGEGDAGFAGHDDWRIPNVKELSSLHDARRPENTIDPAFAAADCAEVAARRCSSTAAELHWTSTTFADFPSLAVAVGFGPPSVLEREAPAWVIRVAGGVEPHEKTLRLAVRAVRGPVPLAR